MNKSQALTKARRLLGPKAIVRVNDRIPVGAERLAEIERRRTLSDQLRAAQAACKARHEELLRCDGEYQRLRTEAVELEAQRDRLTSSTHRRVEVLVDCGWYARHEAGGDNFGEALEELAAKRAGRT